MICYQLLTIYRDASSDGVTYAIEVSQRLGRTTSKEQYAYMYRYVIGLYFNMGY